jgi:hypothetical protein
MLGFVQDRTGPRKSLKVVVLGMTWRWAMVFPILALAGAVSAQPASHETEIRFDIPSQPLETALDVYGAASRLQVLYETALTAGKRSTEVSGVFTREAALRRLLSGTGLAFGYTDERAFTLVPAAPPKVRRVADFNSFLGSVQADLMAALCSQSVTRPGKFRLAMQFWIGGSGGIEHPSLLDSTGVAARDAAITDVLVGMRFRNNAPADMPQPITIVLRAGPPAGTDECSSAGQ